MILVIRQMSTEDELFLVDWLTFDLCATWRDYSGLFHTAKAPAWKVWKFLGEHVTLTRHG